MAGLAKPMLIAPVISALHQKTIRGGQSVIEPHKTRDRIPRQSSYPFRLFSQLIRTSRK